MILDLIISEDSRPGPNCRIAKVLEEMTKTEAEELKQALAGQYSSAGIARALCKAGYKIHVSSITRHRRLDCACGRA